MIVMNIIADGTQTASGPPFNPNTAVSIKESISVIGMPNGMKNGDPSVILRIQVPGGKEIWAETSLKLFTTAAKALEAYYTQHHGWKP